MRNALTGIAYFVLLAFALAGLIITGTIAHEYSHFQDFKKASVNGSEICGLVLPQNWSDVINGNSDIGYYKFYSTDPRVDIISKYTENKAYTIDIIMGILFMVCLVVVLVDRYLLLWSPKETSSYQEVSAGL